MGDCCIDTVYLLDKIWNLASWNVELKECGHT